MTEQYPVIALTVGEPAGIGPDLALMLAAKTLPARLVAIADPEILIRRQQLLGTSINIRPVAEDQLPSVHRAGELQVHAVHCPTPAEAGKLDARNAGYVLETISKATRGCISGQYDAMLTGPVHKGIINDAGFRFSGHTEFIAEIAGGYPVMMLTAPGLRVALVTTHLPLADISAAITPERLRAVLDHLLADLSDRFAIQRPRVLVCGLNPHAGESGHLGREELEIIQPVLDDYRKQGHDLIGPLPADTLFTPPNLQAADAVLAMYHDQGLPVLKYMGFGQAVNITLGLPIIRTSVDHGTALDRAGSGDIHSGSLEAALLSAIDLANNSTPR